MYSIPGELIRLFFDASPFILSAFRTRLLNFQIFLYMYMLLLNIIMLIPISLCVISTIPFNSSASLRISFLPSLNYYGFFHFPSPRIRRSGAALYLLLLLSYVLLPGVLSEETAHSRSLRHVIVSLELLFWAAFLALGLSRLRGATSPSTVARTGTSIFPEWLTSITPRSLGLGRLQHVQKSIA